MVRGREGCEVARSLRGAAAAAAEAGEALPAAVANAAQGTHTPGRNHSWEASRPDRDREAGGADFEAAVGGRGEVVGRVVAGDEGEGC